MRLADFILAHIEPILAEWEAFARDIWPSGEAGAATDPATLRDDAEHMLRAAVADMKSDQTAAQQSDKAKGNRRDSADGARVDRASSTHGSERHGSGFDLAALVAEYRALRASVIRLWRESDPNRTLSDLSDLTRFNESIDQSLTEAILAFSNVVQRERQAALDDQSRQARKLRDVNEALLVSSVRQHELTEQAQQAESLVQIQKQLLEMLVQGEPLDSLLDFLARSMERQSQGGFLVAIHQMEADGYHFGYVAAPSLPASYAEATKGMDARLELGCCSSAVMSRQPTVVRDFVAESRWPAFTAAVVAMGLRGGFTTPILSSDQRVLGTFAIYYREPRDPTPHDRELVDIVTHTVALAIDRKQAETALRESEERFRMVADNMAPLAWTCDTLGKVTWYNQRWLDYTGLSFEEMKGWDWSKVQHPDHLDRVVKRVRHSAETGEPWEDTFPLRGKDGRYRWFLSRALAIRDAHGKVLRWFGTNTDVTEQRALEMQLHQQAAELSELHRRKDEFLAMLSHELRNPLAPIANAMHLLRLQAGNESRAGQQARAVIERQVGQLKHLIDDLLEVSRITTGRIHLHQERISLGGVVANAVETTRTLIAHRGHTLKVSVPPEPIWLYADAARMEQVVVNLLTNAAKYTDPGGHISVTAEVVSGQWPVASQGEEGPPSPTTDHRPLTAVLRVRDTGVGIAPELLPRIFDLFTQADRSLARSEGGLGIGLSLVQRLTELQGGTVEAHSVLGQGSEFVVRLPTMAAASPPPAPAVEADRPPGNCCRVLVVDDNVDAANSLAMLLESSGYDSRTAHDGPTALAVTRDYCPDVVLLDIGLPGLDGFEVAKRLRQQPTLQNIVLVAMTGYGQETDRQRSREAGFDHHLVKPADFQCVQKILAAVAMSSTPGCP